MWVAEGPSGEQIMGTDVESLLVSEPPMVWTLTQDLTAVNGPIATPTAEPAIGCRNADVAGFLGAVGVQRSAISSQRSGVSPQWTQRVAAVRANVRPCCCDFSRFLWPTQLVVFGCPQITQIDADAVVGRRTSVEASGGAFNNQTAFNSWGYNPKSELTSSRRYTGEYDPTPDPQDEVLAEKRLYGYDQIGNRQHVTVGDSVDRTLRYCADDLNRYNQIYTGTQHD